jgi:hypothetical protein
MKFHIDHKPPKQDFQINHHHRLMLTGSCFSENIGAKFLDHKFKALVNPFGIAFNPLSISCAIKKMLMGKDPDKGLFVERDGRVFSYLYHSEINGRTETELLNQITERNQNVQKWLEALNVLIISFGTAFAWFYNKSAACVANCHKQPSNLFSKRILTVDEIVRDFSETIARVRSVRPDLKIIFTVSPVKYLKDGLEQNSLSKSTLLLAVNQLCENNSQCFYFPAYELVTDDLRDYRFYKEDLAHPNELAIDYVWHKFSEAWFNDKTLRINVEIEKLQAALNHRPLQADQLQDPKFLQFIEDRKAGIRVLDPSLEL